MTNKRNEQTVNKFKVIITFSMEEWRSIEQLQALIVANTYQEVIFYLLRHLFLDSDHRRIFLQYIFSQPIKELCKPKKRRYKNLTVYLTEKEKAFLNALCDIANLSISYSCLLRELLIFEHKKYNFSIDKSIDKGDKDGEQREG